MADDALTIIPQKQANPVCNRTSKKKCGGPDQTAAYKINLLI